MIVASWFGPLGLDTQHTRVIPAARADCFGHPFVQLGKSPANLGDWFVTEAIQKTIRPKCYYRFGPNPSDVDLEIINRECDILILKGGNFIYSGWLEKNLSIDILKKIKIPITFIGGGIQASRDSIALELTPIDIEILRIIHGQCKSTMVRGNLTADHLASLGIKNTRVIGCPTLFWSLRPVNKLRKITMNNVGWTFRSGLFSSDDSPHRSQFNAIRTLRDMCDNLTIFCQGEEIPFQNYVMKNQWNALTQRNEVRIPGTSVYKTTRAKIGDDAIDAAIHAKYSKHADIPLLNWIKRHAFFTLDIHELISKISMQDFVIGCRLHGNAMALSNGTPTVFFTYDKRTEEMASLWQVPRFSIDANLADINFSSIGFTEFEGQYRKLYVDYFHFLSENNIAHNLHAPEK